MKIRSILPAFLILSLLSACGSPTANPDEPVGSDGPTHQQPIHEYQPKPGDSALKRGPAFVEGHDLLILESYPLQFMLTLRGNLPTPCNQIRVMVAAPDANNVITVDVYSLSDPNLLCAEVIQPFEVNLPLGSFAAGHYRLMINGEPGAEFDA